MPVLNAALLVCQHISNWHHLRHARILFQCCMKSARVLAVMIGWRNILCFFRIGVTLCKDVRYVSRSVIVRCVSFYTE